MTGRARRDPAEPVQSTVVLDAPGRRRCERADSLAPYAYAYAYDDDERDAA